MSELVDPLGRPVEDLGDIVTAGQYVDNVGKRSGVSDSLRAFIRKNPIDDFSGRDPETLSRSQRQLYALNSLLAKSTLDALQLWMLVGALTARVGGSATFPQAELMKYQKPANWPVVMPDEDRNIVVTIGWLAKPAEVPVETPA